MAHRVVAVTRSLAPTARILARTRYPSEGVSLRAAGADLVVVEDLENIVQVFAEVMRAYQMAPDEIERHEAAIRAGGYAALVEEVPVNPRERMDIDPHQTVTLSPTEGTCGHVAQIRAVQPSARGCEECLRTGDAWVHLRICMTCGHVGCCDSSKNKHATKHFHATAHPIVRSLERGELWGWCYADKVML
jgi:CPA2 family monovalent cation:H+ antiporter-2